MKTDIKEGIYIVDAEGEFHLPKEWKKQSDPTTAQCVALVAGQTRLLISKKNLKEQNFDDAQKSAAKVTLCGTACRCAARKESHDIYDARFRGLDEAMQLIGGDRLTGWYWTCEADPDPECNIYTAFVCIGRNGYVNTSYKNSTYNVRPVADLKSMTTK